MPPIEWSDIPSGSEEVAIQLSSGGGLPGPCCLNTAVPPITVYGNGRVVYTKGSVGQISGMRQATLDRADVAGLLNQAKTAGLLGQPEFGQVGYDMGYTQVILRYADKTHEFSVDGGSERRSRDLTREQVQNRVSVTKLETRLAALVAEVDGRPEGGYAPAELAVYVAPAEPEPGVEPTAWPLERSLAEGGTPTRDRAGRCLHVTTVTRTVVAAARKSQSRIWSSAGRTWLVIFRPLLPHEHACP